MNASTRKGAIAAQKAHGKLPRGPFVKGSQARLDAIAAQCERLFAAYAECGITRDAKDDRVQSDYRMGDKSIAAARKMREAGKSPALAPVVVAAPVAPPADAVEARIARAAALGGHAN